MCFVRLALTAPHRTVPYRTVPYRTVAEPVVAWRDVMEDKTRQTALAGMKEAAVDGSNRRQG